MAAKVLSLRCKSKHGQSVLDVTPTSTTIADFKELLFRLTDIPPTALKVLVGFPPKPLDLSNEKLLLSQIPLHSGETLIVEEGYAANPKPKDQNPQPKPTVLSTTLDSNIQHSILMRKVVPANNSCLFASVQFAISGGQGISTAGPDLRKIIAESVAKDPETFNKGFLGQSNKDYCRWILDDSHWGGAIELFILSKHFGVEIVAVDTQNIKVHCFGEDANYGSRILVIYDGIHYDPLMMEPIDPSRNIETVFSTSDDSILKLALEIAEEAKTSRQFTDVKNFTLRCMDCMVNLTGQIQAQQHAKETGHVNFGEM